MTEREAAIVSAYTGYLIGSFSKMHDYVETKLGRPVFTHEMASDEFQENLRVITKSDFCSISIMPETK